jgi:glycosyltransferase involved in cell wall biosynthesis
VRKVISVIMPAFNSAKTIARAMDSVINQTYKEWELIVIDDSSTDETSLVINHYLERNKNIRYERNKNKKGVSGARNTGIACAKGDYIAFLDSDDAWLEIHLQECLQAMEMFHYQLCSALWCENVFGIINRIGDSGWFDFSFNNMQKSLGIDRTEKYWKFDERLFPYIVETEFYCFHINTVVVKKELVEKVGGFDETFETSEDLDFIYRMLQYENLITVNRYHFTYYYGENNVYAFCDRGKDLSDKNLSDRKFLAKLVLNVEGKIWLNTKMKELVKASVQEKDAKRLLYLLDKKRYERFMTVSWLNKKYYPIASLSAFLKALRLCRFKEEEERFFFGDYRKQHLYLD